MLIRLYSPLTRPTGYGRAGVELARTLLRIPGVELEISAYTTPGATTQPVPAEVQACITPSQFHGDPDVVIVHTLPNDCVNAYMRIIGTDIMGRVPKMIAYTTWETEHAPSELCDELKETFDQVWVPSQVTAQAFAGVLDPKVVPHAFDPTTLEARRARPPLEGQPYTFYYVGAWTQRKNPMGVIRAYLYAFTRRDNVRLVLQVAGVPPAELALALGSSGISSEYSPMVMPFTAHISDAEIIQLHASCDCFVSASRGEAWNLGAYDAYLAGNHVIAPKHQGSDEFLGNSSAALYGGTPAIAQVDVKIVSSRTDGRSFNIQSTSPQGVDGKTVWTEPDLLTLATYMRAAEHAKRRTLVAPDPVSQFSYEAVAKAVATYLQELE